MNVNFLQQAAQMATSVSTKVLDDKDKEVCHSVIPSSNANGRVRCKRAVASCLASGNLDEDCISRASEYAQKIASEDYGKTFKAYEAEKERSRKTRNTLIAVGGLTVIALGVAVYFAAKKN